MGIHFVASERAWNFALYSKHATAVTLHLFSETDTLTPLQSYTFDYLKNKSGRVWHCRLGANIVDQAHYYAYQVDGPNDRHNGHRFDPQKHLLDPFCRNLYFPPAFSRQAAIDPGSNAGKTPLGIIHTPAPKHSLDHNPNRNKKPYHRHDTVIYELHVKGFTRHVSSGINAEKRGTFSGLIEKIPYLQLLGVTAVELMPVFQFDPQENKYWGYMPLSFFAPHQQYSCSSTPTDVHDDYQLMIYQLLFFKCNASSIPNSISIML